MLLVGSLSFLSGILLVYLPPGIHPKQPSSPLFLLGIFSLVAAYFYTAGKKSYGYIGLGDLFVFLFFGLLPVPGVFYLNAGFLPAGIFLPAVSIGLFSTGVLNLNNMRDIVNDRQSGKITIPVRLGREKKPFLPPGIDLGGWIAAVAFTLLHEHQYGTGSTCLSCLFI
jgi:1,4-dihydroxy-2-naphthoate polyprenyltransferase